METPRTSTSPTRAIRASRSRFECPAPRRGRRMAVTRKTTVVIADDEPLARRALRGHLATVDWIGDVHEAADGWAAIHAVESLRPQMLFLDVVMPGVSGLEVAEQITHRPYIVFTTAYEKFAVTAFEIGALDYLLKPFGRDRIAG